MLNMKVTVIKIKRYRLKKYLNKIRPYSEDMINNLIKCNTLKIQLTIEINFVSS